MRTASFGGIIPAISDDRITAQLAVSTSMEKVETGSSAAIFSGLASALAKLSVSGRGVATRSPICASPKGMRLGEGLESAMDGAVEGATIGAGATGAASIVGAALALVSSAAGAMATNGSVGRGSGRPSGAVTVPGPSAWPKPGMRRSGSVATTTIPTATIAVVVIMAARAVRE